jgi:hypothetical protein
MTEYDLTADEEAFFLNQTPFEVRMAERDGYFGDFSDGVARIKDAVVTLEQVRAAKRRAHEAKLEAAFYKAELLEKRIVLQGTNLLPPDHASRKYLFEREWSVGVAEKTFNEAKLDFQRKRIVARVTRDVFNGQQETHTQAAYDGL